ncbi:hypothetical protein Prudu_010009 [Prunus dulcis]|uniref:O-methyltransferase C-terminal domain-containing protein n=1 Tax=Prunus dulcis TaxID=3755 RepID=A0A4Y1R7C1_PRUDU|nr:hypothetical protein Prudu_010009 [Prunus dulcis]
MESDEVCLNVLKNCRKAIPEKRGKVIIIDNVVEPENDSPLVDMLLVLDSLMMVHTPSERDSTESEWKKLLEHFQCKGSARAGGGPRPPKRFQRRNAAQATGGATNPGKPKGKSSSCYCLKADDVSANTKLASMREFEFILPLARDVHTPTIKKIQHFMR